MRRKRTCRTCGQSVNANAIVRNTGQCIGCNNAEQRARRAERMPDTLKALVEQKAREPVLTAWELHFVEGLAQRFRSGSIQHLTAGQAEKLAQIARQRLDQ